jgi:hypothetical protein
MSENEIVIERPKPTPEYTGEWVTCSCCGKDVHDTPETNRDFEERGQDTGYGHCTDCFGERTRDKGRLVGPVTEAIVKRRLGWAGRVFYETRFETLAKALSGEAREKFEAMPYPKKVTIIARMIEKGFMV